MNHFFEIFNLLKIKNLSLQLGQLPVYKLRVTRWEYSSEKLDTGLEV